jgi:hypothetical protein
VTGQNEKSAKGQQMVLLRVSGCWSDYSDAYIFDAIDAFTL